ncbi:glutathione S-transferase family protein [Geminocystis sp.]|uniref:glutathione S-transferase family protein n=1 Tax=Geminocystis sp. TaxID=2664100 RepID=UPI0035935351
MTITPLTWQELEKLTDYHLDTVNGLTNSQALLRLFNQSEENIRVTLYRDYHAWCPYCQKVWLWLEEKQIPYRIKKVTMFCYGQKESWYKEKVPSGMLPAIELDGRIITESDDILLALENAFGVLGLGMQHPQVMALRKLERLLFRGWCSWLCYPTMFKMQEENNRKQFLEVVKQVEAALSVTDSPYFLEVFSIVDVIFTPYVERMSASLYYYKGYSLREENPYFSRWFDAMETRTTYRGTQSDFHTHAHDLPPQMGGCYENGTEKARINQKLVDEGDWFSLPDVSYSEPKNSRQEALYRVLKHRHNIIKVNPTDNQLFDEALRCALTNLMTEENCLPPPNSAVGLRYLRDRISIPRDMSIYAGKRLRTALEHTASLQSNAQPESLPIRHRRDQNPINFT